MATRGAIGRPTPNGGWEAVYHHYDSYPMGLGRMLWNLYHGHFAGDIEAMRSVLIDQHRAGWSTINDTDFNLDPGFKAIGNPAGDRMIWNDDMELVPNPIYENNPRCYCHGDRSEPMVPLMVCGCAVGEEGSCEPLHIEWAYVLTEQGMEVYTSAKTERGRFLHVPIFEARWGGIEPDWETIEKTEVSTIETPTLG